MEVLIAISACLTTGGAIGVLMAMFACHFTGGVCGSVDGHIHLLKYSGCT